MARSWRPMPLGIHDWSDHPDRLEQGAATFTLDTPYFSLNVSVVSSHMTCRSQLDYLSERQHVVLRIRSQMSYSSGIQPSGLKMLSIIRSWLTI